MKQIKTLLWAGILLAALTVVPRLHSQTYSFSTVAGGTEGDDNGIGTNAQFFNPTGVAFDSVGNIYVADLANNAIRLVTPSGTNWNVTTIAGGTKGTNDGMNFNAQFNGPTGIAVDSATNLYVADQFNDTIRKIAPSGTNWVVTTIAGQPGVFGTNSGAGGSSRFFNPTGVAVDSSGNVFVADEFNNAIRELTPSGGNWNVSTIAGGSIGSANGTNSAAQFSGPSSVALDPAGRVYVADQINNEIRLITPQGSNWVVSTIAGQLAYGSSNGIGTNALFHSPVGIAIDSSSNVYVSDEFNYAIRELIPSGTNWTSSTLGGGTEGESNGVGASAQFNSPKGVAVDADGDVAVADSGNNAIRLGVSSSASSNGAVQVTIIPAGAVTANAAWSLDGGASLTNGSTLSGVAPGQHTVTFVNATNYTTPAPQFITVTAHRTNFLTGNYAVAIPNAGSLQVLISPAAAANAGAQWQVDSQGPQTNGAIVAGLSIGAHTLTFSNVTGWIAPSNQTVQITNAETTLAIGDYTLIAGALQVTILPQAATNQGAKWQLDGGEWRDSGATVSNLAAGQHTIDFNNVIGFTTPPSQNVIVTSNALATATGNYSGGGTNTVIVTAVPPADGSVTGSGSYPEGTTATITATPNSGFEFVAWAGNATGTSNSETITVNTNLTIEAYFAPVGSTTVFIITNGSGKITPKLDGLDLKAGRNYSLTATPNSGNIFTGWTGSITTNRATVHFKLETSLVLQANFIASPYPPFAGVYNGLFVTSNGVTEQTAGMLRNFTVHSTGTYSGTLFINGAGHALGGSFNYLGMATNHFLSQGQTVVATLALVNDGSGPQVAGVVTGTTNGVAWTADLLADLGVKTGTESAYTMLLPPDANNAPPVSSPGGDGYALINDNKGTATITGALADGVTFSEIVPVAQSGYVPIFANLYAGKGLLLGWINLTLTNTTDVSLTWIHPATRAGLYQGGFTNLLQANQILLAPWAFEPTELDLFTNVALASTITNTNTINQSVSVATDGKLTGSNVTGSVNIKNGSFTVTIGKGVDKIVGHGAVLINATNGGGYFVTKTNAQAIELQP